MTNKERLERYLDEIERLYDLLDSRNARESRSPILGWNAAHERVAQQATIVLALTWTRDLPERGSN